ncbi:MAG: hypothetical protein U9O56_06720 [Campylobacterota bacterium]|nr:hypothetical protein [Campylobacterota bacterium]
MKIPNGIFWLLLCVIALFYIFKGNDMHKEKIEIRKDMVKSNSNNSSI